MRIVLAPVGGADEVLPMIALGESLRDNGHPVLVCAPEKFRGLIMRHNLRMVSSGASFEQFLESGKAIMNRDATLVRALAAEVPVHFVSMRDALREADLLIGGVLQFAGPSLAEQLGIPYMCAVTSPLWIDEEQFPAAGVLPESGILSGWRRSQRSRAWNDLILKSINRERQFSGLVPVKNLFNYCTQSGFQIVGVDPELTELKDGENRAVTGFWIMSEDTTAAQEWSAYFSESKPIAFVGPFDIEDLPGFCEALKQAGYRVLLSGDWEETQNLPSDVRVFPANASVPREVSVVVHKGSSRFTAAAARAGVPQVVLPAVNMQAYWAEKIQRAGIGPEPAKDLESVPAAIRAATSDSKFRDASRALSETLLARDGFATAIALIEAHASK